MAASPRVLLIPPVKIFVSLVHKPRLMELVEKFRTRLAPWGVALVLALEEPRPGYDVDAKSRDLIDGVDGVLFLCSKSAVDSKRVIGEYVYAGQKSKPRSSSDFRGSRLVSTRYLPDSTNRVSGSH